MAVTNQSSYRAYTAIHGPYGSGDTLQDFCSRWRVYDVRMDMNDYRYDYSIGYRPQSVDVKMDRDAFDGLVKMEAEFNRLNDIERAEREIRYRSPAVRKAWEDYQLLLRLAE